MHDIPYVQSKHLSPETTACMAVITDAVVKLLQPKSIKVGVQVLASANKEALSIAKATGANFIRNEGFVFSHIADEGFTDANAGQILRYRRQIDAEDVLIFTDIKKKHSSHAITSDLDLLQVAQAAEFFLSDGIILTGEGTGQATKITDLDQVYGQVDIPILIGSGITLYNVKHYYGRTAALIVGSYFKKHGKWINSIDQDRVTKFMDCISSLRSKE